jgi:hypothetical protein
MGKATEALVVLARVRSGEAEAARAAIDVHWNSGESPFAAVPGTHLGRLQLLTPPARRGRRRTRECVLLAADADAPLDAWLERLRTGAGAALDAVLRHCAFYPGAAEPAVFARWIAANRLEVGFSVVGSDTPLVEVTEALALREAIGDFAERTQRMEPAALHEAWRVWRDG